jgi:hypothetical protein
MSQEKIDRDGGSLLKAIDKLHEEDRVFYWRLVYQDKKFAAELRGQINYLLSQVDADGKSRDSR